MPRDRLSVVPTSTAWPTALLAQAPPASLPAFEDPLLTLRLVAFAETARLVGVIVRDLVVLFDSIRAADARDVHDTATRFRSLGH